jgi:hypothetical protein
MKKRIFSAAGSRAEDIRPRDPAGGSTFHCGEDATFGRVLETAVGDGEEQLGLEQEVAEAG